MKVKIKSTIDKMDSIFKSLDKLQEMDVLVGVPSNQSDREDNNEVNNAMIGYIHEFGSPEQNIPERPFLIPGVREAQLFVESEQRKAALSALDGKENKIEGHLNRIGLHTANKVKSILNSGEFTPLSDATLKARANRGRKGAKIELKSRKSGNAPNNANAKPLVDTAQLRNSITYVIRSK